MKVLLKSIVVCAVLGTTVGATPVESRHDQIAKLVVQIQRADYEGDRDSLRRLYNELEPFVADKKFGAKVRYWLGFALWRRAFNGTTASANEIEDDLTLAAGEFEKAVAAGLLGSPTQNRSGIVLAKHPSTPLHPKRHGTSNRVNAKVVSITQGRGSCATR